MHYAFGAVNKLRLNAHPKAAELDVQARPADEVDTSKGSSQFYNTIYIHMLTAVSELQRDSFSYQPR